MQPLLRLYRDAFSRLPRDAWTLSIAVLVNRTGTMVLPFLTLYLTKERGYTEVDVGWLFSIWGLAGAAGTWLGGRLCDTFDPKHIQTVTLFVSGAMLFGLGFAESRTQITVGFILVGIVGEAFRPANAVALANVCPPDLRRRGAALRRLAVNLGMAIAPVVGGFLAATGYLWLFVVDGLTTALSALVLVFFLPSMPPRLDSALGDATEQDAESREEDLGSGVPPSRDPLFLGFFAALTLTSIAFFQVLTIYLLTLRDHYHLDEKGIGIILALNPLVIVLVEMALIQAVRRLPSLPLLAAGALCVGVGLGLLPFSHSWIWAACLVPIWTLGEMLLFPIAESVTANRASPRFRGRYFAFYSMSFSLGIVAAPPLGAWAYERFGGAAGNGTMAVWLGVAALGLASAAAFQALGALGLRDRVVQAETAQPRA